ncbi:hypothetical protein [Streptomyces sp. NPDC002133]|uniref:hypothetical protein n=1 Tax=Streptomyces sp. NPDC002133 TaxID=3154409 RepID=UPI00333223E2
MAKSEEPELTVYYRYLASLLERSDDDNFRALLKEARRVSKGEYETSLYDHQQAFRLLWHHLDHRGYLHRAHRDARTRLASGRAAPDEAADLELFLTIYAGVRANPAPTT